MSSQDGSPARARRAGRAESVPSASLSTSASALPGAGASTRLACVCAAGAGSTGRDLTTIEGVIADLAERQARLTAYLEQVLAEGGDIAEVARVFALHGQNASRLGRLLRDKRALSGDSADSLLAAIGTALDEISTELGIKL
jgi:hypothetical protein